MSRWDWSDVGTWMAGALGVAGLGALVTAGWLAVYALARELGVF